ncbi:hypothetical protein BGZ60DRAFT_79833 [Tricladium varicosporioides]|nr:hypothetical protein BGZ60DRAFT_79833 [Hymenoscyphus varicosporioides]
MTTVCYCSSIRMIVFCHNCLLWPVCRGSLACLLIITLLVPDWRLSPLSSCRVSLRTSRVRHG